jgi:hypothetical protein
LVAVGLLVASAAPASAATPVTDNPYGDVGVALTTASGAATSVYSVVRTADRIYIGGSFDKLTDGTSAKNIAAFRPDGSVDTNFTGKVNADGAVRTLALGPDGNLYLGGTFKRVTDPTCTSRTATCSAHTRVARLNALTGALDTAWAPSLTGSQPGWKATDQKQPCATGSPVSRSPVVYGIGFGLGRVYVGGTFAQANGTARDNAAAFDMATGNLLDWRVDADNGVVSQTCDIHGPSVRAFLVNDDGTMYVAGEFDVVDSATRQGVVKVNSDTGQLVSGFTDPFDNDNDGFALVRGPWKAAGDSLFVAGAGIHNDLHILRADTGARRTSMYSNGDVQTLTLQDNKLYVGGHFLQFNTKIAPPPGSTKDPCSTSTPPASCRIHIARVDTSSGTVDGWAPQMLPAQSAGYFYGVWSLFAYSDTNTNNYVYAGGAFKDVKYSGGTESHKKVTWFQGS